MLVREAGEHDVLPEDESAVPLAKGGWRDAAEQVLHETSKRIGDRFLELCSVCFCSVEICISRSKRRWRRQRRA